MKRAAALLVGWLAGGALAPAAAQPAQPAQPALSTTTLVCEAVYLPAHTTWTRTAAIGYDAQRVRSVQIDGVPVHTFSVHDTVILTALDNERIQIDTARQTWSSDFRSLAMSQGRCERGR